MSVLTEILVTTRSVPAGWRRARLDALCEIQLGKMLSPASKLGRRPIPYLRNQNVQWRAFDLRDVSEMDFTEEEERKFALERGDLLVCEGGEPGRAAVWDGEIARCCYQKALHRLRAKDAQVDPHFLMHRLRLGSLGGEFTNSHAKTTIAHLPAVRLAALTVAIPPLTEQRRIVAVLNKQMAAVEKVRAAAEKQVSEASTLCRRFLLGTFGGLQGGGPEKKPLAAVAQLLPSKSISTAGEATVEAVTTACLTESGFDWRGLKCARMAGKDVAECTLIPGEVLVARSNTPELVGRASMFPGRDRPIVASDLTIRIKAGPELLPEFLAGYLSYLYVLKFWVERAGGASGSMKKITRTQIAELGVPLPTLEVQRRVVSQLKRVTTAAQQIEVKVKEVLREIDSLPAAFLRRAFSGQL